MNAYESKVHDFIAAEESGGMTIDQIAESVKLLESADLIEAGAEIPHGMPDRYSSLVLEDHAESVYFLQWPEGNAGTEIHDHGESKAIVNIVRGTVKETVYAPDGTETVRFLQAGATVHIPAPYIHKFEDGGNGDALSLHFYYPPLSHMNYYQHGNDRSMVKAGEWKEGTP